MHNFKINAAIQIIPLTQNKHPYKWIDETIEIIKDSGLKYQVCSFATVVEGKYNQVTKLVNKLNDYLLSKNCHEWILSIQIQIRANDDITIAEKIEG